MPDRKRFEQLGFKDGVPFQLQELSGTYRLDLGEYAVYDVSRHQKNQVVRGLYENLLKGKYHKKG